VAEGRAFEINCADTSSVRERCQGFGARGEIKLLIAVNPAHRKKRDGWGIRATLDTQVTLDAWPQFVPQCHEIVCSGYGSGDPRSDGFQCYL
jgi:hypothetical protein